MPEIVETQATPGAPAPGPLVELAVIQAVYGPAGHQLSNILKGAYGSFQNGTFCIDPSLRRADERLLPPSLSYQDQQDGVTVLQVPQTLLAVVKANLAAIVKARWDDMYDSLRGANAPGTALGQMLDNDQALARQAIDAIVQETGAIQTFVSPMSAQGLLVKWRPEFPAQAPAGDEEEGDPNWAIQEQPVGRLHAGVRLQRNGDVEPCTDASAFGTLEARTARNPVDASEDRVDGVLQMRIHAPSAELAAAYADLVATDSVLRSVVFAGGHPSFFQLQSVGEPYSQQERDARLDHQRLTAPAGDQVAAVDDEQGARAPQVAVEPPAAADSGFFGGFDDAPPPPPQQVERPRERG